MCTNFLLSAPVNDGSALATMFLSARCLELSGSLATSLYQVPRGQSFPLTSAPLPPSMSVILGWTNKYGFVGIASPTAFAEFPCFMDGLNEVGLSAAALWLPGTVYPAKTAKAALFFSDFVAWMLGNFATVDELERELGRDVVGVVGPPVPAEGEKSCYMPLHFIVTDATGASLVVEFVDGVMKVYPPSYQNGATADGVLTNAPTYDWQRTNLASYAHLDVVGPATSTTSHGAPVGSGLLGLPGDTMSASRFVKAATLRKGFGRLPADGSGWLPAPGGAGVGFAGTEQTMVNAAMQLVQVIQATPYGTALELKPDAPHPLQVGDWTMWSVVRDHTHRKLYYTTAFNGIMRVLDLAALDFAAGAEFPAFPSIPLLPSPDLAWCEDATAQLGAGAGVVSRST